LGFLLFTTNTERFVSTTLTQIWSANPPLITQFGSGASLGGQDKARSSVQLVLDQLCRDPEVPEVPRRQRLRVITPVAGGI